jgi:uncharacterized protein YbjQ (UPF0145 family)
MLTVTTNDIPGKKVMAVKGLAQGSTVRAKHLGRDFGAGLKNLVGGEISGYSELMREARDEAHARMVKEAENLGANAIVGMRYQTAQVMNGAAEVVAYGTAVVIE